MLEALYLDANFGGARISPACGVAINVESFRFFFFFFLFVRFFVRHAFSVRHDFCDVTLLNVRVFFSPDFAMKALEYRYDFDVVG